MSSYPETVLPTRILFASSLSFAVLLTACGGSTPMSSDSVTIDRQAGQSGTAHLRLENNLNDWWGGSGIPITWKVSEVDSRGWDGTSRPDNAPPQGLQGLVQQSSSGQVKTRLEFNAREFLATFVLTPVVSIDGQDIELAPVHLDGYAFDTFWGFNMSSGDQECRQASTQVADKAISSWSVKTPKGLLSYDIVMDCSIPRVRDPDGTYRGVYGDGSLLSIRNYQKQ